MALTITKNVVLQGLIVLDEPVSANYEFNLILPPKDYQTSLPTSLDNQVIEEVYIHVNHVHPTTIFLPAISLLKNSWGPKIYVLQNYFASPIPTLQIKPNVADTINKKPSVSFSFYRESKYAHAVESNMWMCLTEPNYAPVVA